MHCMSVSQSDGPTAGGPDPRISPPAGPLASGGRPGSDQADPALRPSADRGAQSRRRSGGRGKLQSLAPIVIFDIAGPLLAYSWLRSAGFSQVMALVLSGVLPAGGVALAVIRDRRLDAVGALVLLGIAVGAVLGLASGSARLVLIEGSVPTGIFGLVCLASLWSARPLIYRFALEFIGPQTPKGRDFSGRWQYAGFRRTFIVFTVVWGIAYLAEAAARVVIVEYFPTGTALAISKVMPFAVAGVLVAWMAVYGQRARRRGEAAGAAAAAAAARAEPTEPAG